MDLKNIPSSYHPAYAWLWNSTITKEGIRAQIEEMYEAGIRAFYIIGEPKEFRPDRRRTYLSLDYLSEAYVELVYYAFQVAEEQRMYTWLYNEGGFPSGMACGQIRKAHPELAQKTIISEKVLVLADTVYAEPEGCLATFAVEASDTDASEKPVLTRITSGVVFASDTEVTQYFMKDATLLTDIQSDNAELKNTELFLKLTHEALKAKFGEHMGKEVTMMFDDEAAMGRWTRGLDRMFLEKYGYDLCDYMPYIACTLEPETEAQFRAKSDYCMLCGELVTENYFQEMRKWLNKHNMLSVGHLDRDNCSDAPFIKRYGNMMKMLRQFDVPGIDVIWNQVSYPQNGKCCYEGNSFFPRLASSAARQQGHSKCLTESFAVYGSHVTPDEMRFVVNFQAVRGISLYNFMVISYSREGTLCHQFRPSFIKENPGMDCLRQINEYTARLSYILQESKAEVNTALYYPQRTICAGGEMSRRACLAFDDMGHMLEEKGIVFDIIDEEFVEQAKLDGSTLVGEHVSYENVFVPETDWDAGVETEGKINRVSGVGLEPASVLEKLAKTGKQYQPCFERSCKDILARKLLFADGSEGYFICNTSWETVEDTVTLHTDKLLCGLDLYNGELYEVSYQKVCCTDTVTEKESRGSLHVPVKLLRGEGVLLWLTDEKQVAMKNSLWSGAWQNDGKMAELTDFTSYISRRYTIDPQEGAQNSYYDCAEDSSQYAEFPKESCLGEWPKDFSGEVTYITKLTGITAGKWILDLGEVRHFAKVYLNGQKVGEVTMPPYRQVLENLQESDELKIVVANTIANVCHNAEFFALQDPAEVGPYHEKMIVHEAKAPAGGLLGPVRLWNVQ